MLTSEAEAEKEISENSGVADGYNHYDSDEYDDPQAEAKPAGAVSHCCSNEFDRRACKRDLAEARPLMEVVLFPFAKSKKKKKKKKQTKPSAKLSPFSYSGGGVCVAFCCTQPRTLESATDFKTSDPNDPSFTYEMLKALVETNHFYSKDCNPHSV